MSNRAALRATQQFFGPRAAGWDDRFSNDAPQYARAVGELRLRAGMTALDLGCGTGRALLPLRAAVGPSGRVVGLDATIEMLTEVRRQGRGLCRHARQLRHRAQGRQGRRRDHNLCRRARRPARAVARHRRMAWHKQPLARRFPAMAQVAQQHISPEMRAVCLRHRWLLAAPPAAAREPRPTSARIAAQCPGRGESQRRPHIPISIADTQQRSSLCPHLYPPTSQHAIRPA